MLLGYAYPAFECYKTVEKNRVEIEELRFWCQYWIIVAMLTVGERFSDIFISWLPMYGEVKLALFIYLWYPKTKGAGYIYGTLLRPYVARHETDIDRKLLEMRARGWDMAIYYWQHCAKLGHTTFIQIIQFLASQSAKVANPTTSEKADQQRTNTPTAAAAAAAAMAAAAAGPAPPPPVRVSSPRKQFSMKKRTPMSPIASPTTSTTISRTISQLTKSNLVQVQPDTEVEETQTEAASTPEPETKPGSTVIPETRADENPQVARPRLRRLAPMQ